MTKKATTTTKKAANPENVNKIKEAFLKAESAKAEKAEKMAKVPAAPKVVMPKSIAVKETINGPFAVTNSELVGDKFVNLVHYVLNDSKGTFVPAVGGVRQGHGINLIDFRCDNTVGFYSNKEGFVECPWYCWTASRVVGCSVTKCVSNAFEATIGKNAQKSAKYQNIEHLVWQNLLVNFFHELHHAETAIDDYYKLMHDEDFRREEEEKANIFAKECLYEIATQVNIEPEISPDIKHLIHKAWEELDLDNTKDPEVLRFVKCQEYMTNTGDSWVALSEDMSKDHHIYSTYKDFLKDASGSTDDEVWSATVPTVEEVMGINKMQAAPLVEQTNTTFENDQIDEVVYEPEMEDEEEYVNTYGYHMNTPGFQGVQQYGGYQQPQQEQQVQYYGNPEAIAENAPQQGYQQPAQQYQQPQQQVNQNAVVGAGTYERPNMDVPTFQATINGLYRKIYNQMFNACRFNPHTPNQPAYDDINRIKEQIPLTPEENMIVKEMDCFVMVNGNEQMKQNVPVNGWISGRFLDQAGTLPGFVLALTDLNGNRILRKFLPQNPWKMSQQTGQYTGPAVRAQNGHRIAWVLDPNNKGFDRRFYDGTFETKDGQYWVAKEAILNQNDQKSQHEIQQLGKLSQHVG